MTRHEAARAAAAKLIVQALKNSPDISIIRVKESAKGPLGGVSGQIVAMMPSSDGGIAVSISVYSDHYIDDLALDIITELDDVETMAAAIESCTAGETELALVQDLASGSLIDIFDEKRARVISVSCNGAAVDLTVAGSKGQMIRVQNLGMGARVPRYLI